MSAVLIQLLSSCYPVIFFVKYILSRICMSIGFIHITKTGGTDFKDKLTSLKKEEKLPIYYYKIHDEDAFFYKQKNIYCFAIIREPLNRFISAFKYNTKGSEMYSRNLHIKSLSAFINILKKKPSYLNNFENGIQFKKQIEWLNGDNDKTFIIKYNDDNNCYNIQKFLKVLLHYSPLLHFRSQINYHFKW